MIELVGSLFVIIPTVVAVSLLAAIAAALARRWSVVRNCAFAAVIAALGLIPIWCLLMLGVGEEAKSKATSLAKGISNAMNCEAIALPILVVAIPCWLVAKRRARRR